MTFTNGNGTEVAVIESKHVAQSNSAWGVVIAGIPLAMQIFGINPAGDEQAMAQAAVQHVQSMYLHIMELVGMIQVVVGRVNARQPLHFMPGAKFYIEAETGRRIPKIAAVPLDLANAVETKSGQAAPKA